MAERIEFGYKRTICGCSDCRVNCENMPGFLIPSDLDRMIPHFVDPLKWAEENLLASPGAKVANSVTGETWRVPTLVPAVKFDHSCIYLTMAGQCKIHDNAPFGCAFFDCRGNEPSDLSLNGLRMIKSEWDRNGLYRRIWVHLATKGKVQIAPEILRERMRDTMRKKRA